jgi:peptide/nickel transport system substrate-binding protein
VTGGSGRLRPRAGGSPLTGAVLALTLAACLAGCSTGAAPPTGTAITTLPARAIVLENGGSATIAVPYLPVNYNPSTPAGANRITQMVMEQVWPQPFVIDPQYQPETSGLIDSAELVGVSPQTVQYDIDPRATWSDGTPITVSDFIYNWHEQVANASSLPFSGVIEGYRSISSVTGSNDGKTVTVVFSTPYSDWESLFSNLVPAHVAQRVGWSSGFSTFSPAVVVSGGPFEIASVTAGKDLVLQRNPLWWGKAPHLQQIVFRVVPAGSDAWGLLTSGAVDVDEMAPSPTVEEEAALADLPASTTLSPLTWQLCFNLNDPVVGVTDVRQAVAQAMDRDQLAADTIGLLDPGAPVLQSHIFLADAPGVQDNSGAFGSVDDARADALLVQAGYRLANDGYYVLKAPPTGGTTVGLGTVGAPLVLTLTGPSGSTIAAGVEQEFQAEMKAAGIEVHVQNVPAAQLVTTVLPTGTYQIALAPFVESPFESLSEPIYAGVPDVSTGPTNIHYVHGSSYAGPGSLDGPSAMVGTLDGEPSSASRGALSGATFVTSNVTGLVDPAIATLYAQADMQLNPATARGLYNEIDTLLWQELPTVPLFEMPVTLVTERSLVNVEESPTWAGPMWNAEDWAIAENLQPTATTG